MHYNWGGDVIFRDTRLPNKRFVIGSPDQPVATDIREWLRPADNRVFLDAVAKVPGIPRTRGFGDFDRRAHALWAFVARHVRYDFDKDCRGYEDFWLFGGETLALAVGDCEDSSLLLAAMMVASGISSYCVRVVLGNLYEGPRFLGAHAWVIYQDEFGIWRLLESTLDAVPPSMPPADAFTRPPAPRTYHPTFCFNGEHLWWIRPPAPRGTRPPVGLDPHLRQQFQSGIVNAGMPPAARQQIFDYSSRL
jgi:hypothetical protein